MKTQNGEQSQSTGGDEIYALSLEKFRWKTEGYFDQLADLFDDCIVFVHLGQSPGLAG